MPGDAAYTTGPMVRDRWIVGVSEQGGVHLARTVTPRFMARVCGPRAAQDLDVDAGMDMDGKRHVMASGHVLHHITWCDPPPNAALFDHILCEAEEAWLYITAMHPMFAAMAGE